MPMSNTVEYKVQVANGWSQGIQDVMERGIASVSYVSVKPNPSTVKATIDLLTTCDLRQGLLLCLLANDKVVGVFAGRLINDNPVVNGWRIAHEMLWFVDVDHRGPQSLKLLSEFEVWARFAGADYIACSHPNTEDGLRLGKTYESLGYKCIELAYIKLLDRK